MVLLSAGGWSPPAIAQHLGYQATTVRTALKALAAGGLPAPFADGRPVGSGLYFLVTPDRGVQLHRIRNDQLYHAYAGDPLELLALYPDGRMLVTGSGMNVPGGPVPYSIVRLLPNGSLDPTFTLQGMAVSIGVEGLWLLPDGRILIGGDFSNIGPATIRTIARLNPDGTLDPTFDLEPTDEYTYWNVGLALSVEKFTFDFRYWDTDIKEDGLADERFVFTTSITLP